MIEQVMETGVSDIYPLQLAQALYSVQYKVRHDPIQFATYSA